jgi:CHAP domain-containing protein/lysozyme-like protein
MQRFVYTPRVEAYIHLSSLNRAVDITDDIISGSLTRRLNALSEVQLVLQNKNAKYIDVYPITAMDKIIVRMSRVGQPFQVFAGYIDDHPFYQLYPGPVSLSASCTLKLLQHTYFDPGLPTLTQLFQRFGWLYNPATGELRDGLNEPNRPEDRRGSGAFEGMDIYGGIGDVIAAVLTEPDLGGWSGDHVHILDLPEKFIQNIASLREAADEELGERLDDQAEWLRRLLRASGTASVGDSTGDGNTDVSPVAGTITPVEAAKAVLKAGFKGKTASGEDAAVTAVAVAMAESGLRADVYNGICCWGIFQINIGQPGNFGVHYGKVVQGITINEKSVKDPYANAKFAFDIYKSAGNYFSVPGTMNPWQAHGEGKHRKYLQQAQEAVAQAREELSTTSPGVEGERRKTSNPPDETTTKPKAARENKSSSPIANRLLSIAIGESKKGIHESGDNSGPEIRKYQVVTGTVGLAWCGAFVAWCFREAGLPLHNKIPNMAAVNNITLWGEQNNYTVKRPRPGDIVTFGRDDHVGLVIRVNGNDYDTVEGNSSDGVNRRSRTIDSSAIFIRVPGVGDGDPDAVEDGTADTGGAAEGDDPFVASLQSNLFVLQLQSDSALSWVLRGKRAIANDIPLLNWISTMVEASGRVFTSLPNGDFMAFYPDRFGYFQRTPYFRLSDIEIVDLNINKNDKELTTHLFATGQFMAPADFTGAYNQQTSAVASVEEEAFHYFVNVDSDGRFKKKDNSFDANAFLRRFGARPMPIEAPQIRHRLLLWMYAWMKFTEQWSKQFSATGSFTFMPELFPGGLVAFGDRITMFIEEVTHSFDMDSGFSTTCSLSSPAALDKSFDWMPLNQQKELVGAAARAPQGEFE